MTHSVYFIFPACKEHDSEYFGFNITQIVYVCVCCLWVELNLRKNPCLDSKKTKTKTKKEKKEFGSAKRTFRRTIYFISTGNR